MRRVELFGPPGVGKTTIAASLNRPAGLATINALDLDGEDLPPSHRPLAALVDAIRGKVPGVSDRWHWSLLKAIARDAHLSRRADAGSVLIDEGLAQGALLLHLLGADVMWWTSYANMIPVEGLTVLSCVAEARQVAERGQRRLRKGGLSVKEAVESAYAAECVCYRLAERGATVQLLECGDDAPPTDAVAKILEGRA